MKILLDFDGVMITFLAWQPAKTDADGFLAFNEVSVKNLNRIIAAVHATTLVLTTTHRIKYSIDEWKILLKGRGIAIDSIEKINHCDSAEAMKPRHLEIAEWAKDQNPSSFLILDDDAGLSRLPDEIKLRWVKTDLRIGIDERKALEAIEKANPRI